MSHLEQTPVPGSFSLFHRGDVLQFTLKLTGDREGRAWLRTTIGSAGARRSEIIRFAEANDPVLGRDWHDIPMRRTGEYEYSLSLLLLDPGCFEAKTFFLPDGKTEPLWPAGDNARIKVGPAEYCCGNTIYAAFVRQFGPSRNLAELPAVHVNAIKDLDSMGYTVIPRSGTFRDLIKELDFIIGTLRERIILLLPIHPIPTTYARMGRFGSPFAALNFADIDPALAGFDRSTTPLDQFRELADAIHGRGGRLFIDIPVNHTGWASHLQAKHPEWFVHNADRSFQSPGAWGITWEDLSKLDYRHRELWKYMAEIFLLWRRRGVDGFRCDAGYMIPYPAWEYIVAKVREEFPNTIFMLEGLGGKAEVVESLLAGADMDWAYSELFQNYDRGQIESYLPGCIHVSSTKGLLMHFAETHDNERLAARSHCYARMRTALCALCSQNGAFGITNGVEWLCNHKIDVHDAGPLNWGSKENQVEHMARLNTIVQVHPAFQPGADLRMIQRDTGNVLVLRRSRAGGAGSLLIVANLSDERMEVATWSHSESPFLRDTMHDLVSGRRIAMDMRGGLAHCQLGAGEVLCLSPDHDELMQIEDAMRRPESVSRRNVLQCLQAKAFDVYRVYHGNGDVAGIDPGAAALELSREPREFCAAMAAGGPGRAPSDPARVTTWEWPADSKRVVMVPPGYFLCVKCPHRFVAELRSGDTVLRHEESLPLAEGGNFALILPMPEPGAPTEHTLTMVVYEPGACRRTKVSVLYLSHWKKAVVRTVVVAEDLRGDDSYALCTNGRGAMAQIRGAWGEVRSQYDALLAGNLHPEYPVDRQVMLTRCRGWVVNRGYSQTLNIDCLDRFSAGDGGVVEWSFGVPVGQGKLIQLDIRLRMCDGLNAVVLEIMRKPAAGRDHFDDDSPVKIILRPDVEDRVNHWKTKAFAGPEHSWPGAVRPDSAGFTFSPSPDRRMSMSIAPGRFTHEPEWQYMVGHPVDAGRGFEGVSDLFSPGYFTVELKGGHCARLYAEIATGNQRSEASGIVFPERTAHARGIRLDTAMRNAIRHFVVKRDNLQTVIAGYPWFLDWGRDTLICLRGMIAAGMMQQARSILEQFARFERQGTLPNMLRGNDASDRDTSDAPLWFFTACADLMRAENSHALLDADAGGRTVRQVLRSIADNYMKGTPNGIAMDHESGLIFSPSHFTWMDTNFPAGSPREGYPIEIQALWHAALELLAVSERDGRWHNLAEQVRMSIQDLFMRKDCAFFSDCLHAGRGQPAAKASGDDALRPNQLLAITLGAVADRNLCAPVLAACEGLLVPGAVRSLADRPVKQRLPVYRDGVLLNNPVHPYWGRYEGDEDTHRKPAYHNGTAWTWLFPSYCEAMFAVYGEKSRETALSVLSSSVEVINRGCLGQVPEIVDGDAPHTLRGCGAQAWGATEIYRVLAILLRT